MNIHPDTAKAMLAAGQISQEDYEALTVKPKNKYSAWKAFVRWLRLQNTGWNPFFSPSLYELEHWKKFADGFKQGYKK